MPNHFLSTAISKLSVNLLAYSRHSGTSYLDNIQFQMPNLAPLGTLALLYQDDIPFISIQNYLDNHTSALQAATETTDSSRLRRPHEGLDKEQAIFSLSFEATLSLLIKLHSIFIKHVNDPSGNPVEIAKAKPEHFFFNPASLLVSSYVFFTIPDDDASDPKKDIRYSSDELSACKQQAAEKYIQIACQLLERPEHSMQALCRPTCIDGIDHEERKIEARFKLTELFILLRDSAHENPDLKLQDVMQSLTSIYEKFFTRAQKPVIADAELVPSRSRIPLPFDDIPSSESVQDYNTPRAVIPADSHQSLAAPTTVATAPYPPAVSQEDSTRLSWLRELKSSSEDRLTPGCDMSRYSPFSRRTELN